ncbi:MAG: FGGY-family carbohydrate kinase [Bacilli bacterium]|nr:FGGY-family carbohydrate kinase [Bacilli bacterium]
MEEQYILTIDFGTQSVKVAIFNDKGEIIASEKEKYSPAYFSELPNYAEQDPDYYFECMARCTNKLAGNTPDLLSKVAGATISCFRDSAVLLDKDNKVVRPMILWLDQRMAEHPKKLPLAHRLVLDLVGMRNALIVNQKKTVANWVKENEPENWAKVKKYLNVSTYFIFRLTGEMKDSASSQAGHYPNDAKHRDWYKRPEKNMTGQIFGVTRDYLCEIVPEGSCIGGITEEASKITGLPAGLKVYACGSDKSCETLGLGVIDDSIAAISYGTASSIETTRKKYTVSEKFIPPYPSCIPGYYNMDIQIYRGYWMINWFLKEFGGKKIDDMITDISAAELDGVIDSVPPGCDGLVLQPYWGPGLSRPFAKGAIIGFSDSITQLHFYRAIIEGIGYALREGLEKNFEKRIHHKINELRVSGGGSQSDAACQITADIFNRPVTRVQTSETSSLGAAIAGFLAIKRFSTPEEAIEAMVHLKDTFTPRKKDAEIYEYLYKNAYLKMYPRLGRIYKDINDFNTRERKPLAELIKERAAKILETKSKKQKKPAPKKDKQPKDKKEKAPVKKPNKSK